MKQYFKNLWTALRGGNPYQMELERVKEEYKKTAERVNGLNDSFLLAEQKKAEAENVLAEYAKKLEEAGATLTGKQNLINEKLSEITSLQTLVENLRDRIDEKDEQMAQMNKEFESQTEGYKKRIATYSEQVARLQAQLDKAKKRNKANKPKKEQTKEEKKS